MEFKGTKGKWEVYTPDHIGCTNVKFGRDIWDGFVEIWHHQSSKEEAKANAQLISKAPEMLKALEEVLGKIDWSYESFGSTEGLIIKTKIEQLIKEATI